MARLSPSEKQALLEFARQPPLRQPPPPAIPFADYLRAISKLPPSLRPEKPVRFTGNHWKL
jgi:hypothetical protein